ncbi:MAG: hypothetical protein NTY45_12035 [Elusimicrobia bacterium]|nr:hypothetical protein [Elusimicrobiota bacterium]
MRLYIVSLVLLSGLLLSLAPAAQAAKKHRAAAKAADSGSEEIPPFNWNLAATGFIEMFTERNREIESAEPNRFFPGSVAFALGKIDADGHYLMLKCYSVSDTCGNKRDALEERMVYTTFLEAVRTKVPKDQLYNMRTWELTPLGEKYMEKLRKRYPDLPTRLARLVRSSFARKS